MNSGSNKQIVAAMTPKTTDTASYCGRDGRDYALRLVCLCTGGVFTMRQVTEPQPTPDDLAEAIDGAMRGMHELRDENAALCGRIDELEHHRSVLESENASLKAQLDNERLERRHYHSLANEIITRLDVVGRTVDDVVQRAQHEVYSKRKEQPGGDLPELKIPNFLKQSAPADGRAEPRTDAPGRPNIRPVQAGAFPKRAVPEPVTS
jgi:hypothetical protein